MLRNGFGKVHRMHSFEADGQTAACQALPSPCIRRVALMSHARKAFTMWRAAPCSFRIQSATGRTRQRPSELIEVYNFLVEVGRQGFESFQLVQDFDLSSSWVSEQL